MTTLEGPDHKFALNPKSWKEMVEISNEVFETLGDGIKKLKKMKKMLLLFKGAL